MPEPHRITVPIVAKVPPGERTSVQIRCNGALAAEAAVGAAWTTITFDTDGSVGENAISIAAPAPVAIGPFQVALP